MMKTIDLTPLYRNSVGFDRFASLLDTAFRAESAAGGYPPYNIESLEDNYYSITLAVAGFTQEELNINVERGVLSIRGEKGKVEGKNFLYQGIANRTFERKFNLADYIEVTGADLENGLLTINLLKIVPEAMKPRTVVINTAKTDSVEPKEEMIA
ncbi:heat-shock protein [Enterovibrio norvegicus FF-33]|nr:heat-shock protein [Enterovibrio norvegicus FF-33]